MKLIPDWFVTIKMIKKIFTALYADENILYFSNEMGIPNIDLNNINLDNNYAENDPDIIFLVRLFAWHIKFEKYKTLKKKR